MDLIEYKNEIKEIKDYASKHNISPEQVNEVFKECFYILSVKKSTKINKILKCFKFCILIFLIAASSIVILYNHPKTHNICLRNLQNFIYPGLRIFRKLAVPIISTYPSLTEWYDEWCILENPYFSIKEMDCMPCSTVRSVQNLTDYNISSTLNPGIPFSFVEKSENVDMNKLFNLYLENKDIFDTHAEKVTSNKKFYRTISDVMSQRLDEQSLDGKTHITWRINRMEPGRKLRKLFPKLIEMSNLWSPSTEKFIFIDEPNATEYSLPNPECSNVIIKCTYGKRLIKLLPSPECTENCHDLTILLSAQQSLWYNWWYWRPNSLPATNSTKVTITYATSFC